jgi:uroporphyrinogen decarboxylase
VSCQASRREAFFRSVRLERPAKTPFYFTLCDSLIEEFERRNGKQDYFDFFDMPFRAVSLEPTRNPPDYSRYFENLPPVDEINEWGVGYIRGSRYHFRRMVSPMKGFEDPAQVRGFPLPDILEDYRWEGFAERVGELKGKDYATMNAPPFIDIFEPAWYLRGFEQLLMDLHLDPSMAEACLERMTEIKCRLARRYSEAGVDVLIFGDDIGEERSMILGPEIWRRWLKPRLRRAIRAAKEINPEVICYYHSDGNIEPVIPDLIEIGVEILNPIQPECMDPLTIKQQYGEALTLWGTVGTQALMPFGTAQEVADTVKTTIRELGYNGGLVIAPTHILEPEVPWENILALVEAVEEESETKTEV